MDTYLLLRSNKKSGPYSFEQLVNFGLKPYDLVWVEGKSAAWRYPSEVDGLKNYAPVTEEQPYDRFYKKPAEKPVNNPDQHSQPEVQIIQKEDPYVLPIENKTTTASKKVFVSMPGNHVAKKSAQPTTIKESIIPEQRPLNIEEKKVEPRPALIKEEPIVNDIRPTEEPTLNEKYSESLEDIKRRYTETYLNRKKKPGWTSTHTSIAQVFGGAVFFCFLVVVLYKNFAEEDKPQPRTTIIQPDKRSINTGTVTTTSAIPPVVAETNKKQENKQQLKKEKTNTPPDQDPYATTLKENDAVINENKVAAAEYKPEKKAVTTKSTQEPGPEQVKPKTRPININKQVFVRANKYKQRAFGGVVDLELTVHNDSKFQLDKVVVELQYLKPSEQPLKTERIVFNSVEPNGSLTLKIPDYLRGVKLNYRVMEIESSQYESYTAGL
ncbi:MAG TPA: hypothetical protein VJ765_00435 [Chitinophagaceae bacterium]|nr:hypothetical protein [Chitinophagaceae bacterium]